MPTSGFHLVGRNSGTAKTHLGSYFLLLTSPHKRTLSSSRQPEASTLKSKLLRLKRSRTNIKILPEVLHQVHLVEVVELVC